MKKGSKMTPEQRARISAAKKGKGLGRKHSEETKAKMRAARLANNPMKGKKHTEETRAKMRAANHPSWAKSEKSVSWKGGRTFDKHGYVRIYMPDHPDSVGNYILEHRYIMEQHIGRRLDKQKHVHHINQNRSDNRIENLILMEIGEHSREHRLQEIANGIHHCRGDKNK